MKVFGAFALAAWMGLAVGSAISIYAFGDYGRTFRPDVAFQMALWFGLLPAVVAGLGGWVGSVLGAKVRSLSLPGARLALLCVAYACAVLSWIAAGERLPILAFYPFVFFAPLLAMRWALGKWGVPRVPTASS